MSDPKAYLHGVPPDDEARGAAREKGFVLIIVIAAIGLLALAAAGFAQVTRSQVKAATGAVGTSLAQAVADSGAQIVALDLVAGRFDPSYSRRFQIGGAPIVCDAGDGQRLVISVTDESGKVDLNAADERLLQALLAGAGVPSSRAVTEAIMDFRDNDNIRRPQGAETEEYAAAKRVGPKNAPFSVIEEIEQVLGVDSEIARHLRPHLTVYSGAPGIDTASASRELREILARGFSESIGQPAEGAPDRDDEEASRTAPRLAAAQGRRFFAVHAEGHARGGVFVRDAIVELGQSRSRPYTFRRWHRGILEHGAAALNDPQPAPCP